MIIVIRNRKVVWKHRSYLLIFLLECQISGVAYREYIKTAKSDNLPEELLSENDIEVVLTTLCCYEYFFYNDTAPKEIYTDQKDYHKCSSSIKVCYIAKIYQSITVKKRLVTYLLEHFWRS